MRVSESLSESQIQSDSLSESQILRVWVRVRFRVRV